MALRPCQECYKDISTDARTCPGCGAPHPHVPYENQRCMQCLGGFSPAYRDGKCRNCGGTGTIRVRPIPR